MFKYCHQLLCALPVPRGGGESKCYAGVQRAGRERWIDLFEVRGWLLDVLRGVALCDAYCKQIWLRCGSIRKERKVISNPETSFEAKLDWAVARGQLKACPPRISGSVLALEEGVFLTRNRTVDLKISSKTYQEAQMGVMWSPLLHLLRSLPADFWIAGGN